MNEYKRSRNVSWYIFLGVEGATAIAVEIVGLRFLAPLFGSSLPIWGLAIAVVLAGLAWGYTRGGVLTEKKHVLPLVFHYAAGGAIAFLWMPVIFGLAHGLRTLYFNYQNLPAMIGAFILAYGSLLIPSVLFGMVSPLAVQAEADQRKEQAGHVAGRVFTITTIGSLLGILAPSLVTIPFFGSRVTVWLFAGLTLILALKALAYKPALLARFVLATILAFIFGLLIRPGDSDILFARQTPHQYVTVRQRGPDRALVFDGYSGIQSLYTDSMHTGQYWDYTAALPALLPHRQKVVSMLILGAAGSTTEQQAVRLWENTKQFAFTSVDIDNELFEIANTYFKAPPRMQVPADARFFVESDTGTYDLILVDTYTRELTVPFHLATTEFFQKVSNRLAPNGIVAININTRTPDTLWLQSIAKTLHTHMPYVRVAHVPNSCNFILLGSYNELHIKIPAESTPHAIRPLLPAFQKLTIPPMDGVLLTDDRSPTDLLGLIALLQHGKSAAC